MEGTLEELRRISNCPEGATFSQLSLRKSVGCSGPLFPAVETRACGQGCRAFRRLYSSRGLQTPRRQSRHDRQRRRPASPRGPVLSAAPAAEKAMCARIIGAAFHAFMEKGYAGTSTLEIATRPELLSRVENPGFPRGWLGDRDGLSLTRCCSQPSKDMLKGLTSQLMPTVT